jgi:hypothetical protein
MATDDSSNTSPTPQLTPTELSGLARRLNARAESVLLRDQPEQQSDMRQAARFLDETLSREIIVNVRDGTVAAIENLPPGLTVIVRNYDIEAPKVVESYWRRDPAEGGDPVGGRLMSEPTDLFVDITGDDGTSRRNVPLREAVGNDPDEYEDCRQTLLADGTCTTGGGASPLYHLELAGNDELARLRAGIGKAIESTTDPVCRNHLRDLLEGC